MFPSRSSMKTIQQHLLRNPPRQKSGPFRFGCFYLFTSVCGWSKGVTHCDTGCRMLLAHPATHSPTRPPAHPPTQQRRPKRGECFLFRVTRLLLAAAQKRKQNTMACLPSKPPKGVMSDLLSYWGPVQRMRFLTHNPVTVSGGPFHRSVFCKKNNEKTTGQKNRANISFLGNAKIELAIQK